MAFDASHADSELPPVDQRLAIPETRFEVQDGELVYVAPADELHGIRHSKVVALVELHAAAAFDVACDMLTRTSKVDDIAPDVIDAESCRPSFVRDPDTMSDGWPFPDSAQCDLAWLSRRGACLVDCHVFEAVRADRDSLIDPVEV